MWGEEWGRSGAPTHFLPHFPTSPSSHLSLRFPLPPPHSNTLSYTSSYTSSHISLSSPYTPTHFPTIPTYLPSRSQSVAKLPCDEVSVVKLPCGKVTGDLFCHSYITPCHMNITSYSILLSSRTQLLAPGHTNPNQTKATDAEQTEAAMRIKPKTSAAFSIIRCTIPTELSRSCGNLSQNGA